jgi:hypothetical protein
MWRFWLIPRQRLCPHLRLESFLTNGGMSKMWLCPDCHVYWSTVGSWPWFWRESRECQHPTGSLEIEWGTHEVWCLRCNTYLGHPSSGLPDWLNRRLDEQIV